MPREKKNIEETASTITDLVAHNISYAEAIQKVLKEQGVNTDSPCPSLSFLVAARHITTRSVLENLISSDYQIIELGAGFSPHGLNYASKFSNWIEIDLPINSQMKEQVVAKLNPALPCTYVSGDIFSAETWEKVRSFIDVKKPVFIFCEGVVSHYATEYEKDALAQYVRPLLKHPKSYMLIDDTLKNHPNLDSDSRIVRAKQKLRGSLQRTSYAATNLGNFETERTNWQNRGFAISLVPYQPSRSEFAAITNELYGLLCQGVYNEG